MGRAGKGSAKDPGTEELDKGGCLWPGGYNSRRTGPLNQRRPALAGRNRARLVPRPLAPPLQSVLVGGVGDPDPRDGSRKHRKPGSL